MGGLLNRKPVFHPILKLGIHFALKPPLCLRNSNADIKIPYLYLGHMSARRNKIDQVTRVLKGDSGNVLEGRRLVLARQLIT